MANREGPEKSELAQGENPSTTSREEAQRWISVYTELVEMESSIIQSVKDRVRDMSTEARRITEKTNLPDLEKDADQFQRRLSFWRDRLAELKESG